MRLAFKSKTPDLYEKFSRIGHDLGDYFDDDEYDNVLSPEEEHKFITWDIVIAKQKQLERQFYPIQNKHTKQAYELNNDLLLLSLYSLIPPLRNEIKHLNFTVQRKRDGDYIWYIWLHLYMIVYGLMGVCSISLYVLVPGDSLPVYEGGMGNRVWCGGVEPVW